MRHLVLLILPAIFGMVHGSGEIAFDYNPFEGPPANPQGPLVVQNHGAIGDPIGAKAGIEQGGWSGRQFDYNFYEGPPQTAQGPQVNQAHGAAVAPQTGGGGTGGSSQGNDAGGAPQVANQGGGNGGSSQGDDRGAGGALAGKINPQIIPGYAAGGDSNDYDGGTAFGAFGGTTGRKGTGSRIFGGAGRQTGGGRQNAAGTGGGAGDSSNSVDGGAGGIAVAPNAAPVAGGADVGDALARGQNLESSPGMSSAAVAGIVAGVVAVGAVGTAVAVVVMKSGAAAVSAA